MSRKYEVFISFKNLDKNGQPTQDAKMAEELYYALEAKGIHTFFSNISIGTGGGHDYMGAIDRALEEASICVAVATSAENLKSPWVANELSHFDAYTLSGNKPRERSAMLGYYGENVSVASLPGNLRACQAFYSLGSVVGKICSLLENSAPPQQMPRGNAAVRSNRNSRYDVFISFKNLDKNGQPTQDAKMAEELYYALEAKGIHTFFSNISIGTGGEHDYMGAIDRAIKEAVICVAVGTSIAHLESNWVAEELKNFRAHMLSGNKPRERCAMYSYISKNVPTNALPGNLISCQAFFDLKSVVDAISNRFQNEHAVAQNFAPKVMGSMGFRIGDVIDGKYKILTKIGQGGMSVVYLAINEKANKHWAVKEVRKEGIRDFEAVKMGLIAEIDILKKLNHPALPSVVDVIDREDDLIIVMDYIEGNALSKSLAEFGAQPEKDVIAWAKQLCDVLSYLHSRTPAIIYRDMKPGNVMLKPNGSLCLIDFGTAREYKPKNLADTTCLGTIGYAAPEQFGGIGQTDGRTDIYCLGATLHHLVTGCDPSKPPYELYPIRQINPELSYGLEYIINKCVQRDPEKRYQSAEELMIDLENIEKLDAKLRRKAKGGLLGRLFRKQETKKERIGKVVTVPAPLGTPSATVPGEEAISPAAPVFAVTTVLGPAPAEFVVPAPKPVPAAPKAPIPPPPRPPMPPLRPKLPVQPGGFAIPGQPIPPAPKNFTLPGQLVPPVPKPPVPVAPPPIPAGWNDSVVLSPPQSKVVFAPVDPGTTALYDRVAVCLSVSDLPREGGTVEVYFATEKTYGEVVKRIVEEGGYKNVIVSDRAIRIHRNDTVTVELRPMSFSLETNAFSFRWGDHIRTDSCAGYTFQIGKVEDTEDAFLVMTLSVNDRVLARSLAWFEAFAQSEPVVMELDMAVGDPYLIRLKNGERIELNKPVFRLGKERSYVDYCISDNQAVSRSHADVITRNGQCFLVDTNSVNHTYLDGEMLHPNTETPLRHGAVIRLADEQFEFHTH